MTDAKIGHNNPPTLPEDITAPFDDYILEAENWSDGEVVENEDQMKAVDGLIKQIKAAKKAVKDARDNEVGVLNKAWKDGIAKWQPTQDDLDSMVSCLVAAVAPFKKKLADEKEAAKRKAWQDAEDARIASEKAIADAKPSDIEAQREAQQLQQKSIDTQKAAQAQSKDTVKGMRKVHKYEITDHRAALHFIAKNYRDDVTVFVENWVQKNHKTVNIDGVEQRVEKEAF